MTAVAAFVLRDRLFTVARLFRDVAVDGKSSVEAIHNLRVATRRALAGIKLFRALLPATPSVSMMLVLKVLLRTAGQIRDLDVLIRPYRKAKNDNVRQFVKELHKHRARKQRRLSELCSHLWDSDRLTQRIDQLLSKLDDAGSS